MSNPRAATQVPNPLLRIGVDRALLPLGVRA